MYPNYQHPLSLVKRREHRLGFNIVDYKQAGRLPECPNREQYETTSTHGAVRHAFRISAFDEESGSTSSASSCPTCGTVRRWQEITAPYHHDVLRAWRG
ncbi:hypothetical protein DIPPA_01886 [Diplonema papillatum]|nr:hypothetical protein DIPPA_01886 [Diplonema papillatum]